MFVAVYRLLLLAKLFVVCRNLSLLLVRCYSSVCTVGCLLLVVCRWLAWSLVVVGCCFSFFLFCGRLLLRVVAVVVRRGLSLFVVY